MERVTLIASLISCISWRSASTNLILTPRDTESKVNDSTYFNCSTEILSQEIHWSHGDNRVYAGGLFYEPYLGRFQIEINSSTGAYNLVIPYVGPQDAGEYFCQDDGGHGRQSPVAKLIVLADEPTCQSNLIQDGNSCELQPGEVQLSCSIAYYGNIPPKLEWRKAGENSLIEKATSVESGNITTYSITLKTDLSMDSQSYVCQTTRSVTSQYKCNSETIRLQYVFRGNATVNIAMDEEVICSANSSQSCNYKWKWFSGSDSLTVSTDQILKPTRVGLHRCEATCPIGNSYCVVDVMFAEVHSTEATSAGQMLWLLLLLLLLVIILVTIILIVVVLYRRRKRAYKRPSTSQEIEANINKQELSTAPLMAAVKQNYAEPNKRPKKELELSTAQLIAEHKDQVKPSDAEPSEGPKEEVETSKTDELTIPLIDLKVKDKEQEKQSLAEPDQCPKEEVGAIKTDQPKAPLTAQGKEEINHSDADPNKSPKVLSLFEGEPEVVSIINREEDRKKRITGLTVLKNELLVAAENSPALGVYDIHKYDWRGRVPIPEMVNPFDLASCHITACVFISDSKCEDKPKEIIRMESSKTVGKRWSTGDDFGNVSVSSESNIILCISDKNMLIEYTRDGDKIRVINLPGLVHPHHAIKLTSGEFLVSHGYKNDTFHRVCSVNMNGEVVKSFGGEKGTFLQRLNEPNYLIVDKEGFIVVADSNNKRLLLLDSDLKAKREFLTKSTGKMCLCEATRVLFVVDYEVLIINIK